MRALRADEIEVRIGQIGAKGCTALLYKDARTDMNILDEEYGTNNWQKDYKEIKGNLYCGVGVWDEEKKQWIWKWDCGTESNVEKAKGEASDSFKRACFNVGGGIGRELYTSPFIFLQVPTEPNPYDKGKFKLKNPNDIRGLYVSRITYTAGKNAPRKIKDLDISQKGIIIWSTDKRKEGTRHE